MTPIEIMGPFFNSPEAARIAHHCITALEAAGYRIVSAETQTEEMNAAADGATPFDWRFYAPYFWKKYDTRADSELAVAADNVELRADNARLRALLAEAKPLIAYAVDSIEYALFGNTLPVSVKMTKTEATALLSNIQAELGRAE